ncbi:putative metalloprotease CJM1_0395 family protein [Marinobacter algicola]|nr:putative metalloprotease CJM1_0395 family protein [Marinobacter algicola]
MTSVFPSPSGGAGAALQPSSDVPPSSRTSPETSGTDRVADGNAAEDPTRPEGSSVEKVQGLDEAELKQLTELKARDREVRAHEAAHQAVGGQYAGSISYVYERGPDGAQYAVGGEVSISTSPVRGDPQATIDKMRVVRAAALAPAEPSSQDRAVAAEAMQLMLQAQAELSSELGRTDEPGQSGVSEDEAGDETSANQSRQATNAYQVISGVGSNDVSANPSVSFRATA